MQKILGTELNLRIKTAILNMLKEENILKKELAVETLTESKQSSRQRIEGTELAVENKLTGENKLTDNDIKKIEALLLFQTEYMKKQDNAVSYEVMDQFRETLSGLKLIEEKKSQQDASEILGKLISVNASNSEFENEMNKIFGIKYTKNTYCKDKDNNIYCEFSSVVTDYVVWISNDYIKQKIKYTKALNEMKKEESELTNDEQLNKCKYENCDESKKGVLLNPSLQTFQKENYELKTNNPYFIIGLKSNTQDVYGNLTKISKNDFNIIPDLQIENHELFACVEHIGSTMDSGHYISYIKIKDTWWIFNDSQKPEPSADFENLLNAKDMNKKINPILAFYKNKKINNILSDIPLHGLTNVENTCYFNSILQVLVRIPEYFNLLKNFNITKSISSIVPKTIPPKKHLGVGVHKVIKLQKGGFIVICDGTVVDFEGDAIVNAANENCLGGGGVDGAIGRAGGDDLREARENILVKKDSDGNIKKTSDGQDIRCPTGTATITTPTAPKNKFYKLKCDHVIHAVGPVYEPTNITGSYNKPDQELANAYKGSIQVANAHNINTLAFSLLSAGIFGGGRKLNEVLQIAIDTVKERTTNDMEVYMVGYLTKELEQLLEITKDDDTKQLEELPSYKINNLKAQAKQYKNEMDTQATNKKIEDSQANENHSEDKENILVEWYNNKIRLKFYNEVKNTYKYLTFLELIDQPDDFWEETHNFIQFISHA